MLRILGREPGLFRQRVAQWMKATVAAIESTTQSSVKALPRRFGDATKQLPSLPFTKTEQSLTRFDGASELDTLREEVASGSTLSKNQQYLLDHGDPDAWRRPSLPLRDHLEGLP